VRAESSNGHIELIMDKAREVHASTSNSSITVRLPSSADATVDAHTSNSSITCDFDVMLHGEIRPKHRLQGMIGKGGPLLDLGPRTEVLSCCGYRQTTCNVVPVGPDAMVRRPPSWRARSRIPAMPTPIRDAEDTR